LLLGVKGTLSEAEVFTLRTRLYEGRWNGTKLAKGCYSSRYPQASCAVRMGVGKWIRTRKFEND